MASSSIMQFDQEEQNHIVSPSRERSRGRNHRHTPAQIARLEESFNQQPNPDKNQRNQLAQELSLSQKQIRRWFENKRTSKKAKMELEENDVLRAENDRILKENMLMKESLENVKCQTCWDLLSTEDVEKQKHFLQQLKLENAQLKDKIARRYKEQPMSQPDELQLNLTLGIQPVGSQPNELQLDLPLGIGCSNDPSQASAPNSKVQSVPLNLFHDSPSQSHAEENIVSKAHMLSVAKAAKEELVKLLITDEPLWIQSSTDDRRIVLHSETYENLFPRVNPLTTSSKVRTESSKSSKAVRINPMRLVEILMDSDELNHHFPTIISKARTIKMIERGSTDDRSGALSMMYGDMHVLSPFVLSREFNFLRYCEKIQEHAWVITDVSFDYSKETTLPTCSWRFPSGCLIRAMGTNIAFTEVTWVEHVEVDDNIQEKTPYKDVVSTGVAYGAERWLFEIQRMCVKLFTSSPYFKPSYDTGAAINEPARSNLIRLSHRIVKRFCETLNTSNTGFQQVLTRKNDARLSISISKNIKQAHPSGLVVLNVAASFWLPVSSQEVFQFFTDEKSHANKWDISSGVIIPLKEILRIINDSNSDNSITVLRPMDPNRNRWIIQETISDPWASYIVYAELRASDIYNALDSHDPTNLYLLTSGVTISPAKFISNIYGESSSNRSGAIAKGSLVTVAVDVETLATGGSLDSSVEALSLLMSSMVQNIKDSLV